jgi:hypothetical protein
MSLSSEVHVAETEEQPLSKWVEIKHPDAHGHLGDDAPTATCLREAFNVTWKALGWEIVGPTDGPVEVPGADEIEDLRAQRAAAKAAEASAQTIQSAVTPPVSKVVTSTNDVAKGEAN